MEKLGLKKKREDVFGYHAFILQEKELEKLTGCPSSGREEADAE